MFKAQANTNLMAQVLLSEAYDIDFGIFDHLDTTSDDSLKLVAMHPTEDVYEDTSLDVYTERFVLLGVYEITGISLDSFWRLNRVEADRILALCALRKEKEAQAAEAAAENMESLVQENKNQKNKQG